jgi:5'-nucleotidase (lipoprotein e(P4) family)
MIGRVASALAAATTLSGCAAAVLAPVAAGSVVGLATQPYQSGETKAEVAKPFIRGPGVPPPGGLFATPVPPGMQYLYGSAEAAAQDLQTYIAMADFLIAKSSDKAVGHPVGSVVLAPGSTLQQPVFEPCGSKPLAIVLDIDETAVLNLGFEGDQVLSGGKYDPQRWAAWETSDRGKVVPVPGVLDMVEVARKAGITVIFNSNRLTENADATAAMLADAGFGAVKHRDTLWLKGDAGTGSAKDARRWAISQRYCVVAMAGDQLGDFTDLFNADLPLAERRRSVNSRALQIMWGRGWFILPNPVYGSALQGDFKSIFPLETRWTPPATPAAPTPSPPAPATGSSN